MNNYNFQIKIFKPETEEVVFNSKFLVLSMNSKRKTFTIMPADDFVEKMQKDGEYHAILILGDLQRYIIITDISYHANGDLLIGYEYQTDWIRKEE